MQKSTNDEIIVIANSIADEIFEELDDEDKIVLRGDCNLYFVPILVALQNAGMHEKIDTYFMKRFKNGGSKELLLLYPEIAIFSPPKIEIFKAWFASKNTKYGWGYGDISEISKYISHALRDESTSDWFFRNIYFRIDGDRTWDKGYEILFEVIKFKSPPSDIKELIKVRFSAAMNNYKIQQVDKRTKAPRGEQTDQITYERFNLHTVMIILFPENYDLFLFRFTELGTEFTFLATRFEERYEDAIKSTIGFRKVDDLLYFLKTNEINRDNHLYYHDYLIGVIIKVHLENRSAVESWEDFQIAVGDHLYRTLNFYRSNPDLSYEPLISLFNYVFEKSQIPYAILSNLLIGNVHSIAEVYDCDLAIVLTIFKDRQVPEKLKRRLTSKSAIFENLSLNLQLLWLEFYTDREIPLELELHIPRMISTYCDSELINEVLKSVHHLYRNKKLPDDLRVQLKEIPKHGKTSVWVALIFCSTINIDKDKKFNKVVTEIMLGEIKGYFCLLDVQTTNDQIGNLKRFLNYLHRTNDLLTIEQLKNFLYETLFFKRPSLVDEVNRSRAGYFIVLARSDVIESFPEVLRLGLVRAIEGELQKSGYRESRYFPIMDMRNTIYRKIIKSIEEKNKYLKFHFKLLEKLSNLYWDEVSPLSPDSELLIISFDMIPYLYFSKNKDRMFFRNFLKHNDRKFYSDFFGACEIHHRSELSQI